MKKNNILTIFLTFTLTILMLFMFDLINTDKSNEVEKLNNTIEELNNELEQYKSDKLFYKELYIPMANEYQSRLNELGIKEYILTDTSR